MPSRRRVLVSVVVAAVVVVLAPLLAVGSATVAARPAAAACPDLFSSSFRSALAAAYPGQRATATVHDTRTGCWYQLEPGMQITTASVIKAQFLAGVLLRAQDQGRPLSQWERDRIAPMMTYSHNPPASDLFTSLGGVAGQEALDQRYGLTTTTSTSAWGATASTATDRTRLALQLLHGGGPLGAPMRQEAWAAMTAVHPTQQWGITAGVPTGWTVALKNGFFPLDGIARWRIGSTGFVRHDASGQGYAITIMTDRNPDHDAGQRLVETVSRHVASVLTGRPGAPRAVDRSVCTRTTRGESWAGVAARLGTIDVAGVQRVSGGPPVPLSGMRACRPDLRVVFDPDGPTADFVRAVHQTFLARPPSAFELEAHTVAIDGGRLGRLDLTRGLARTPEWIDRTIDALYRSALGRPADASGLRYWRDRVVAGMRITDVGAQLYASDEFFRRSGSTDPAFVAALYREILHRPPDPQSSYWVDRLRSGVPRIVVTSSFYASIESRRDRVTATYRAVLGRGPDGSGLSYWADQLLRVDDVELAGFLAASDEYFNRAQR